MVRVFANKEAALIFSEIGDSGFGVLRQVRSDRMDSINGLLLPRKSPIADALEFTENLAGLIDLIAHGVQVVGMTLPAVTGGPREGVQSFSITVEARVDSLK